MHAGDTNVEGARCQSVRLERMSEPLSVVEVGWQFRHKLRRVLRRRLTYLRNRISRIGGVAYAPAGTDGPAAGQAFVAGQPVRIKSREAIQATLDPWNYLKGCGFMEEMWQYCGTRQRVL